MSDVHHFNAIKYFFAGAMGGFCSVLVGHPMDTVKIRLQTMPSQITGKKRKYIGAFDVLRSTVKKEGVLGLYKGMSTVFWAAPFMAAISFFGYGMGKKMQVTKSHESLNSSQIFLAGGFSALFTTIFATPGEQIKCLLQIQRGSAEQMYSGPIDVLKKKYSQGGIRAVYRGFFATFLRDIPSSALYFMIYEYIKKKLSNADGTVNIPGAVFAGGVAGIVNWTIALPIDVLKTIYQTSPQGKYKHGIRSVFRELMEIDGIKSLYRGATPIFIRAFPANGACFFGYEVAMQIMDMFEPMIS